MSKIKNITVSIYNHFKSAIKKTIKSAGKSFAFTIGIFVAIFAFFTVITVISIPFQSSENEGTQLNQTLTYHSGNKESNNIIARIELYGDVVDPYQGATTPSFFAEQAAIDGMVIKKQLHELAKEDTIKGVVLDLSTYGGSPISAQLIVEGVEYYKSTTNKPVYTFVADSSFSAGAYLSSNSSKIFASDIAGVGSIGVVGPQIIRASELNTIAGIEARNIDLETISEGKNKAPKNPLNPTEEELEPTRAMMIDLYNEFVAVMVQNRGIDESVLRNEMGANMYMAGTNGLKFKLVDEIATREEVFERMAQETGIADNFVVNTYQYNPNSGFNLFNALFSSQQKNPSIDPRQSLCRKNRVLFYHGDIQNDLCKNIV